jgi:hypothetical protein
VVSILMYSLIILGKMHNRNANIFVMNVVDIAGCLFEKVIFCCRHWSLLLCHLIETQFVLRDFLFIYLFFVFCFLPSHM